MLLALSLSGAACSRSGLRECEHLLEERRFDDAARRCEEWYASSADPRSGAAAAEARLELGQYDAVIAWADRLRGTPVEGDLLRVAATARWRSGDREQGLSAFRECAERRREASDWEDAARCAYGGFYAAWTLSQHRVAFDLASRSFENAVRAGDPGLEAQALGGLYTAFFEVGDIASARRALEAWERLTPAEQRLSRAGIRMNEGLLRRREGRLRLAIESYEAAVALAEGETDERFWRAVHLNLAETLLDLDELEPAERHLEAVARHVESEPPTSLLFHRARLHVQRAEPARALELIEEALAASPIESWAWMLHHLRGEALELQDDPGGAEDAYGEAARVVDDMRRQLGFHELQYWLLSRKREPLEALVRLQARSGRPREALASVERAMARTFLDAFIRSMRGAAAAAEQPAWDDGAAARLEVLEVVLPALSESPAATLRPVDAMLGELAGEHVAVYFEAGETLLLFEVHGKRVRAQELPETASAVRRRVERFLAHPDDPALAESLSRVLLPEGALPTPGTPLRIVADGALARLPFAALRRRGRALVEDHELSYAPSLNAIAAFRERRRAWRGSAQVLGDPAEDLPAAAREVAVAAAHLGVTGSVGRHATVAELRHASGGQVLHLAAHTGIDAHGPWLALADGVVSAKEILSGPLAARLVVLAGCASAVPQGSGAWGSLSSAFLSAGSESVLGTLWSVDDRSTLRTLSRFYEEGGAKDPAGGLARAQRALLAGGEPPSVWAPFVVFGSGFEPKKP